MVEDRRTLLKLLTGTFGGLAAGIVGIPSVRAVLAPFRKKTVVGADGFVPVAKLDVIPADGTPVKLPVVVEAPTDAWVKLPPTEVGAVFLKREGEGVVAHSTICPHLGCGVDYSAEKRAFACPCHESFFDLKGEVASGPSPRGLDLLEARVEGGVVQVKYARFKQGTKDKLPT